MFVSALFKTVFYLIFNAKVMSILEITFGISFICNDLDLTEILSKTENALSTAIYQSEVRQLEKNIKFTVRQFASTCLSVKTLQITLNEHQNQPFQLQTTSCPQTHHTKHLSTRYGPAHDTLVLFAYSQKVYLIEQQRPWRDCADAQASLSVWLLEVPNLMYMRKGVNGDY